MANTFNILSRQVGEIWRHFGANQKVSIVLALLLVVGITGGLLHWSSRPSFRLLYSGMSLADAAKAREKLEEERIPVQFKDSGRSLYVPSADVYKCRLMLASEGLPEDSSTGFELFEEPKFGLTDFAQKVNYRRALQGELERTIINLEGIRAARIMLDLPKEKLFASEEEKQASASIMITTSKGVSISPVMVRSIKQLVGSSVSGLDPSSIAITDQFGNMLAKRTGTSEFEIEGANEQLETQRKLEAMFASKAQEMLDKALGVGQSIVKVSALLDFSRIEKRSETVNAEGRVVISETISTESSKEPGAPVMAAAPVGNVPVGNPGNLVVEQKMGETKSENITTEYKVPSGTESVIKKGVRIDSLSVSVCIAAGEAPRTPEQMKSVEDMVKTAVGFITTETRTDVVKVVEMSFPEVAEKEKVKTAWHAALPFSLGSLVRGVFGVIVLIVVLLVSKKVMAGLAIEREEGMPLGSLSGGGGQLDQGNMDVVASLDDIAHLAEQNPKAIAAWITNVTKLNK